MSSYCDVINSVCPVTMTNKRRCSILEFGRGAYDQAVALGITRPLHVGLPDHLIFFQGHLVFEETLWAASILSRASTEGQKVAFLPREIGLTTKNF